MLDNGRDVHAKSRKPQWGFQEWLGGRGVAALVAEGGSAAVGADLQFKVLLVKSEIDRQLI